MKILCVLFFFVLVACNHNTETYIGVAEPPYTVRTAWDSGLYTNYTLSTTLIGDDIYFYERPPGYTTVNIYSLTRLDAKTGKLIWRSIEFSDITFCQPVVIDNYVYVFLQPNIIYRFDKNTGDLNATVTVNVESRELWMEFNVTAYRQYLYFGLSQEPDYRCFARLDVGEIKNGDSREIQSVTPEVLWQPATGGYATAKPVVYGDAIFTSTFSMSGIKPVEIAGFDMNTKQMVFHAAFGGPKDSAENIPFPDTGAYIATNPILIHDGVLYHLSTSISAWDIKTGNRLYRHVFTDDIPNEKKYYASRVVQALYYNGNIFYTNGESYSSYGYRNIFCIDAATGRLVWSTIEKNSLSVQVAPVIVRGLLYIPQHTGFRIYEPETGRLVGVDRLFAGAIHDMNILYGDYLICLRYSYTGEPYGIKLVAVNIGR